MKNNIIPYREKLKLTQADLSEKCNVSRQTIHAVETNIFVPSAILGLKIAKQLKVKMNVLFTLEDKDWKNDLE